MYIADGMQYTFDKIIFNEYSGIKCNQWDSKNKYNVLAIGGDTRFSLLYIDFRNN